MQIAKVDPQISAPNDGALRTLTYRYILDTLIESPKGSRLVDLGAGHCIFSRISRARGYDVTAVDGREERVPEDLEGVAFVKSDVRDFDIGPFPVILIVGLLYHLTLDDQIDLLSRCPKDSEVVVDTQVHIPGLAGHALAERGGFATRPVTENGYTGLVFPEVSNPMASIGNSTSWWHTEESLLTLFANAGFNHVTEVGPPYVSKYGARRWYVVRNRMPVQAQAGQ